ncbi:hypothetical protein CHISP_1981 [Chitinispirillum alkaliphilum]|nr:hypothetical protein CHISP_1981 [Chitinispirillum alkaliphilum]
MKRKYYSGKEIEKLLAVIKRNKEKNLSNSKQAYEGLYSQNQNNDQQTQEEDQAENTLKPSDVKLVLFGAESPFLRSIAEMLSAMIVITAFDDPEKTINFTLEYQIKHVILDLDPPTDCFESINIFSAIKTLDPDIKMYACTKTPLSNEAGGLKHKGAIILPKPLWRKQIESFVKKYI